MRCIVRVKETHESAPRKTFEELARDLECDDDEEAFKAKLRQVARASREPVKTDKPDES
jgi:hypothetical protein